MTIRQAVLDVFPSFNLQFEGRVPWMYLDVKGLVTTGVGDLIDPMFVAMQLPWQVELSQGDWRPATDAEIGDAWTKVKSSTYLEQAGGGKFASLTNLRLTEEAIDELMRQKMAEIEVVFAKRFPTWSGECADAQLGVMSMAWADGAYGVANKFPKFDAAFIDGDFASYDANGKLLPGCCALECHLDTTNNPGLIPRNSANQELFEAAERVVLQGLDPTLLHYKDPT
jgi:hypothetical protein